MSQFQQPSFQAPMNQPVKAPRQENTLGLIGFIISIVGLFICGLPSILGAVVSAFGLRKEPKGLAIAGLLIGLFGLVELALVGFMAYSTFQFTNQVGGIVRNATAQTQLHAEAVEIGEEWEETGSLPNQEEGDSLVSGKRDIYGNSIAYETDGSSFSLRSAGADGILQTEDDIVVGPFEDPESATENQPDFDFGDDDIFSDMEDSMNEEAGF